LKLLDGKYALISGGGRGIGRAVALDFAKNGANIAITARTREELDKTVEEIETYGVNGFSIPADHSKVEDVINCVKQYFEEFKTCDILIANAGMTHISSIVDFPIEDAVNLFNLNVIGTYTLIRYVIPSMIEQQNGRILITSSVQGNVYFVSNKVAYSTSKAAVTALGKTLQTEVAQDNIHVNVIVPGAIQTKMMEYLKSYRQISGNTDPPEWISPIYLFLASPLAKKKYKGRVINQQMLFSGLYQLQTKIKETGNDYKLLLPSLKKQLGKEPYSLLTKNKELVEFMLNQGFEFQSPI